MTVFSKSDMPMALAGPKLYRVVVRNNMVREIEALPYRDDIEIPNSPLEVSSQLAQNNLKNGCLDGDYYFDDSESARQFAILSLDFMKRMVEKSLDAVYGAAISPDGWTNTNGG